jgi:transposase
MAKYKSYDYSQQVLLPVSLEDQLVPGTLEFALHALVDTRMDMSVFDEKYRNDETGRAAYDPKILLKVVLFAYSRGIVSSRKIERACQENVIFMALACGQKPDHSTIAAFVSSMKDEILPLFRDILLVCEEEGLLGGTVFALDGCKISSNASKQWSGTIGDLERKKQKLEKKVKQLLAEQRETDKREGKGSRKGRGGGDGGNRQQQIERLRKKAARIEEWLKKNGPKRGATGKEIKSNVTDNESAMMATWHGTLQGYNGQALADKKHQVILHGEVFGNGQDHAHVPPMLDGAKENLKKIGLQEDYFKGKLFAADSDYHSRTNMLKCEEEGLDAYIPDNKFRQRDPRFANRERHRRPVRKKLGLKDFHYKKKTNQYLCPEGKRLSLVCKSSATDGNIYRIYHAKASDCAGCMSRGKCIRVKKGTRKVLMVPIGAHGINLTKQMIQKVDSEEGKKIYIQRMAIVEPIFGNLRVQKRLDRFTLRGKIKVNIQWLLYCMVHNIEKIVNYGYAGVG